MQFAVQFLVLAVTLLPVFMDLDPYTTDRAAGFNKGPSAGHLFGTDDVGRDLFARLLYGGRISLFVGITSTIISVLVGIPLGLVAGYFRGAAESIIMRTADAFMSFPSMVLILVLVAVFGPSILTVTVVIGVLGWTAIAKLIYGNVLSIREQEYIQAAKTAGIPTVKLRQNAFFQANRENPKFKLILGKYLKKSITCFKCGNIIHTHEEKETDVRIATQIVADAYQKNCDISIVVSADSDMIPAIELATEARQKVFIYFPPYQYSSNLATMGMGKPIQMKQYESRFKQCILPDVVHLEKADFDLHIPEKWKAFQTI